MCLCSGQLSSGTKDAYLRGRRRFKGGLTSLARKPQLPISGPSGTGFAVSDPWHTLQDRQCHIVVNGSVWVGQFAVWRFPVMQSADLEIWEACPLPEFAWQVPNNCVICTCIGSGCVALGGGDYDGDLLMFTSDPALLAFLEFTNGGRKLPEFVAARGEIERHVKSVQFKPLPLTSIMHYRHHCLTTPTPQIRGLLTAMAEKAQQAAFESLAPHRDGSLIRAVRLAVAAEKAYDAPKKVNAKVWMPLPKVFLSAATGAAIRCRMFHPRHLHGIADPVEHIALDEIAGAVRHRIASKSSSVRQLVQAGDADALIQRAQALARSKPKAIRTPSALYFSDLY
ncbi:unnamed protein product [Cladocopium goreaui]|uniref:RNA-dependent RNA polymerase n=1 Tax=Cladocopium goreaui TaxID=2562237 RepID=A0A9P1DAY3_9DINO|nr:unnamed protein product [Cladocopium goreaui]